MFQIIFKKCWGFGVFGVFFLGGMINFSYFNILYIITYDPRKPKKCGQCQS